MKFHYPLLIIFLFSTSLFSQKKKKQEVLQLLKYRHYDVIDEDHEYKYLCNMSIHSLIYEHMFSLLEQRDKKIKEMKIVQETDVKDMWLKETSEL